jgi:cell division protein FtsA
MDKPLACIEISSDSIKLLIGYELNGQAVVLYTKEKEIPGAIQDGQIVDMAGLVKALNEFHSITDDIAKLKINISEACLVLPSLGLQVYQNNKTTNVVSPEGLIAKVDIANVVSLVNKESVPNGNDILDIIPDEFVLDKGQRFANPPIGEKSQTLTIRAKVHALPHNVVYQYKAALNQAGFRLKKAAVAAYCYSQLFASYKDLPQSYVLVDIGAKLTTVSLVGAGSPYASLYFAKGSDSLTQEIADAFVILPPAAKKLKEDYGYDERKISFDPAITSGTDAGGNRCDFYQRDLNAVIASFSEDYLSLLSNAIAQLLGKYGAKFDTLPLQLTGGGSRLNGLLPLLQKAFPKREVHLILPRSIGARDPRYAALLGLVLASSGYTGSLEDSFKGVVTVSRQETPKPKDPNSPGNDAL